jgi:hypothetical protein
MVAASLRRVAGRFDLLHYVWHPALLYLPCTLLFFINGAHHRTLSAP